MLDVFFLVCMCLCNCVYGVTAALFSTALLALTLLNNNLSFSGNPTINLPLPPTIFTLFFLPPSATSIRRSPGWRDEDGKLQRNTGREMMLSSPTPFLFHQALHLASKLRNNTSITHSQRRAHTQACRTESSTTMTEKAYKAAFII